MKKEDWEGGNRKQEERKMHKLLLWKWDKQYYNFLWLQNIKT